MTAPWATEYRTPDPDPTAGVTYDDMRPTRADNTELKRALRAENRRYQAAFDAGLTSRPCPDREDEMVAAAWQAGRWERNRRRQDKVLRWLGVGAGRVAPKTTRRVRRWRKQWSR